VLFGFRGIRFLQVVVAVATAALGVGCAVALKAASDSGAAAAFIPAVILGLAFIWLFGMTLRLPTSFIAVGDERTRIRFGGFVDVIVPNTDIVGARMARHPTIGGLGVRTNFRGVVVLTAATGDVAELELRNPVRVWIIPRLWRVRARKLVVGVRNPQKLVDRFGGQTGRPESPRSKPRRRR